jgi:hypothetical protein
VQPPYVEGDRSFGLFPKVDLLNVNMQLEDAGLRATIGWEASE